MSKALRPHKAEIKAAILAGETYAAVAQRFNAFPPEVHSLLRKDPDIVAAKETGALRRRRGGVAGRTPTVEDYMAEPAVRDVIEGGMSTLAAAKKHGVSQPTLWAKVRRAKELMGIESPKQAATKTETPVHTPTPAADPEIDAITLLIKSYATRHNIDPQTLCETLKQRLH